ncbi:MAG: transglycosylase family protein [Deltaproteobacteria bacterium]|nr:transglycosylase family protein [Deltaproteobacteria bacterium]
MATNPLPCGNDAVHAPWTSGPARLFAVGALALAAPSGCLPSWHPPPQTPSDSAPPPRYASTYPASAPPTPEPPTPAPPPEPSSPPPVSYCSAAYQKQFGWPDPEKAARVCKCESSGNPKAVSPNGKYRGLFQFGESGWQAQGGGDIFDPWTNSHHAHRLFLRKGWRPWPHCGRD